MEIILPNEVIPALIAVLSAVLIDFLLGIFIALKNGDLQIDKIPNFLLTGVIPYIGGMIVLALAAKYLGTLYVGIYYPIALAVVAKYLADIKKKTKTLFSK